MNRQSLVKIEIKSDHYVLTFGNGYKKLRKIEINQYNINVKLLNC